MLTGEKKGASVCSEFSLTASSKELFFGVFFCFVFFYKNTLFLRTCVFCSFRIAVAHRTMFQRGEVHNKPTGFWGMIKSVTTSVAGSESILHLHAGTFSGGGSSILLF